MQLRAVLSSYSELSRVLPGLTESVSEASKQLPALTTLEQAAFTAGVHNALGALQDSEKRSGVLASPHNQIAALMQSHLAEQAVARESVEGLPGDLLEAKFDKLDVVGWLGTLWLMLKGATKFDFVAPPAAPEVVPQFGRQARLAIFGDWGTGLYGAPWIRDSISNDKNSVDIVLHLGDVYYSGTRKEFQDRFSALWPERAKALHLALNANHEMYSGGLPYFDTIRGAPFFQKSTCFSYQNDDWIIIGLDTAYEAHSLATTQLKWLEDIVRNSGGRRIVLFSHHQPFSLLETSPSTLVTKTRTLLDAGGIFAWYWGHEHQCVLYDKHPSWQMWGRCVGNAAMPEFREVQTLGVCPPRVAFQRLSPPATGDTLTPAAEVLDGPNEYIPGHETLYGPHGYVNLIFDGNRLIEEVRLANGGLLRTFELK